MDNNEMNQDIQPQVDWEDDSGEIHTVTHVVKLTKEDGWQRNHVITQHQVVAGNQYQSQMRYFKGTQVNVYKTTDDYRVVIPAYIIGTILVIAICIVVTFVWLPLGVIFDIFGIVWLVGIWAKAPFVKWRNQREKLQDKKMEEK